MLDSTFKESIIELGFSELKIQLPETKISAPADASSFMLLKSTPPSICIKELDLFLSINYFM